MTVQRYYPTKLLSRKSVAKGRVDHVGGARFRVWMFKAIANEDFATEKGYGKAECSL